jgi:PAS domain S-box-containing protein
VAVSRPDDPMMQDYQHELAAIRNLLKRNPNGMSVTDISRALEKNKNTIGRYLDILLISGQVAMRTYGMAKVFTLSQRVPLSALLSYSKELIMVLDTEDRIIDINENFLKLIDLERGDAIGKNIEYLSPPDIDVHELLDIIAAGSGEGEETVTFRMKEKGERIFTVKRIPTVFEDGGKGITIILGDITEHIRDEREIRESEERFRMMAENIRDGLIIMENGKNVYVNTRIAEITGYSFEELMTIDPLSIIAPEDRNTFQKRFRDREVPPEGFCDDLVWIIRRDGERRCVYSRITILHHADTEFAFVILTDITELRVKEAALKESEQRFRMMAENIRDGLVIIENNRIVFSNRRMAEITGFTNEEMARVDFLEFVSGQNPPSQELAERFSTDDGLTLDMVIGNLMPGADMPGEGTFWITRKDSTRRCIHGNFSAAEHDGIISVYITATDITSFAEKEKALRDRIASLQELVS